LLWNANGRTTSRACLSCTFDYLPYSCPSKLWRTTPRRHVTTHTTTKNGITHTTNMQNNGNVSTSHIPSLCFDRRSLPRCAATNSTPVISLIVAHSTLPCRFARVHLYHRARTPTTTLLPSVTCYVMNRTHCNIAQARPLGKPSVARGLHYRMHT
jgi:hypothetical protein